MRREQDGRGESRMVKERAGWLRREQDGRGESRMVEERAGW